MAYFITFFAGMATGFMFQAILNSSAKIDLLNENWELQKEVAEGKNAEKRAMTFARKLKAVEDILIDADKQKEHYFITVEKLKKELFNDSQSGK